MAESIDRYLRLMPMGGRSKPCERLWRPAADIYRVSDGWIVKLDLAGVSAEELDVSIEGPTLRVAGVRRDSSIGEGVSYLQLEITYSRFERTLRFPCSIESAHLVREYRDGWLILHLRSQEENCEERMNERE